MVSFPNAKINLGLNIIGKRSDGFHNLQTVFYPIGFKDILEIIENKDEKKISFSQSGLIINDEASNNLCIKAYHLLKNKYPTLPSIKLHLHKSIPMGAGLGGGSADAAFTLDLLNHKFNLGISQEELMDYALTLGSDCPFFLVNKPCLAFGRGEKIQEINLTLSQYALVVINPGIHINTGMAFSKLVLQQEQKDLMNAILNPISTWKETVTNDFETPVFKTYPEIGALKESLYNNGALYASMSGSGSTVYGIFKEKVDLENKFPESYFYKWV
jgi:4-diphosphocytidyl-2-C-methyl-D-erythritol kinase